MLEEVWIGSYKLRVSLARSRNSEQSITSMLKQKTQMQQRNLQLQYTIGSGVGKAIGEPQ
ncbi:hypothetical protein Ancab_021059, partial [Ancistrocladus abbreviatus]